ncbi:hypothetical protein DXG01_008770 [Tephrocybe rancida]|nr:hypothetical protein DXG01_008770 [Tephrocybe rancida]
MVEIDQDVDVADGRAGDANIDKGYRSNDNPRFVLHDSKGFEPGTTNNWGIVNDFIRLKLPVIVVFTKYDILVNECYLNLARNGDEPTGTSDLQGKAATEAKFILNESIKIFEQQAKLLNRSKFSKLINPFQRPTTTFAPVSTMENYCDFLPMLEELTKVTKKCLRTKETLVPWAIAQRIEPKQKVECSLEEGFKSTYFPRGLFLPTAKLIINAEYMKNLGKSTVFRGHVLLDCLQRLHLDIVKVWNFRDPEELLSGEDFRKEMILLIQPFMPQPQLPIVSALPEIIGHIFPPFALALGAAGLAAAAIEFLYKTYQAIHQTALCLVAYIVDLTLVLHELFVVGRRQPLTSELVSEALNRYKESRSEYVHRHIRNSLPSAQEAVSARTNRENIIGVLIRRELDMNRE